MVITYHGGQMFKVSFGDTTLAFNPIGRDSNLKQVRFGSDIALVTMDHPNFNGTENVAHGGREPFVIDGPGEYEVGGVAIRGYSAKTSYANEEHFNTMYSVMLEGMRLVFLGAIADHKLSSDILEGLDGADILFIPIGGGDVLPAADAHELSVKLEPKIVIPMHYDAPSLKTFLKDEGSEQVRPIDKLTVKKRDLEGKEGEVIVLST